MQGWPREGIGLRQGPITTLAGLGNEAFPSFPGPILRYSSYWRSHLMDSQKGALFVSDGHEYTLGQPLKYLHFDLRLNIDTGESTFQVSRGE